VLWRVLATGSCVIVLLAGVSSPARGQETTTTIRTSTQLVLVPVVVKDHSGRTVSGLKATDFSVWVDKKPQPVAQFEEVRYSGPTTLLKPPAKPGEYSNAALQTSQPIGLTIMLLDLVNTPILDQERARSQLIKYLTRSLPPHQFVTLLTLTPSGLRQLHNFTNDNDSLIESLRNTHGELNQMTTALTDRDTPFRDAPGARDPGPQVGGLVEQEFHGFMVASQQRLTLEGMVQVAQAFKSIPGRKNLIWISETFPFDIVLNNISAKADQLQRHYGNDVAMTGSLLSDAQVAVYPVDARALGNNTIYSAGSDPNPMAGGNAIDATLRGGMGASLAAGADDRMAAHTTMNDLAEKTGGRAFYNRNDLDRAILESMDDGSTYYTLGYYPDNKQWNNQFRNIRVKVNHPGVKLHYRAGYFAVDREAVAQANPARQEQELDQAMTLDWPISTALPFQAQVAPPSVQTKNHVLIRYAIDPKALNFETDNQGLQRVDLMCAVRAYSVKDLSKPVKSEGYKLAGSLRPEAFTKVMSGFFPCQEQVDLPPGKYVLRLGVRDNSTGLIGTANGSVEVADVVSTLNGKSDEKKP